MPQWGAWSSRADLFTSSKSRAVRAPRLETRRSPKAGRGGACRDRAIVHGCTSVLSPAAGKQGRTGGPGIRPEIRKKKRKKNKKKKKKENPKRKELRMPEPGRPTRVLGRRGKIRGVLAQTRRRLLRRPGGTGSITRQDPGPRGSLRRAGRRGRASYGAGRPRADHAGTLAYGLVTAPGGPAKVQHGCVRILP